MTDEAKDTTPQILLEHMRSMETRLMQAMSDIVKASEKRLRSEIQGNTKRLDQIDVALQCLYERRIETVSRLDHIENEELPAIKQAVGIA
ncbi:hypothetical protein KJ652_04335 [Patescibacteria group bacterium]|nr:hypothetical protein [Patescibacteria group bacterium]MBU1123795.1 hypothetical protein [Patescibacteria group bacterium]MBU1910994.1 hypothetical protein [Patescibacteria group bacterium]